MKLFSDSIPFYKANFHCHTTNSDGVITPDECMARYRAAGYDILAITDHRKVTVPENVPDGLLMIPGIEIDYMLPGQAVHILGLGMSNEIAAQWNRSGTPQEGVDTILHLGGAAILAHPAWSLNTPDFIASLHGICGTEIWNSISTLPYNADRAESSSLLDSTWSNYGSLLPVFANDDAHFYGSEFAVAATYVQAGEKTQDGVLHALQEGRFFASQGPVFHQIEYADGKVTVHCSPADTIIFYSNAVWIAGRSRIGHGMTESVYEVSSLDRWVRVEIRDQHGKKAWSAPFAVR